MLAAIALFAFQILQGDLSLYAFLGFLFFWLSIKSSWPRCFQSLDRFGRLAPIEHALHIFIWSYLVITMIQALVSPYHLRSMQVFFKLLALYLFYLHLRFSSTDREKHLFFFVCLLAALLQVFGGVWQVFFDSSPMPLSWASTPGIADPIKRAYGLQSDPNVLGNFLGLMMLGTLCLPKLRQHLLCFPVVLILGFGLILTQSRGALIAAIAALLFMLFLKRSKMIICLLLLLIAGMLVTKRSQTLVFADLGVNQRVELMSGVLQYIKNNLIWGTGPGSFHLVYPEYRNLGGYYPGYAHNHLLEVFCEQGLVGLMPLALAMGCLGFIFATRYKHTLMPVFIFSFLNSLVGHSFSLMNQCLILVLILGIGSSKGKLVGRTVWKPWLLFLFAPYFILEVLRPNLILSDEAQRQPYAWFFRLPALIGLDLGLYQSLTLRQLEEEGMVKTAWYENLRYNSLLREVLPNEAELPWLAGRILQKVLQDGLATAYYAKAYSLDPFGEKYAESYLRRLQAEGRCETLIPIAKSVLGSNPQYRKINPYNDRIFVLQLACHLRLGQFDELISQLQNPVWVDEDFGSQVKATIQSEIPNGL